MKYYAYLKDKDHNLVNKFWFRSQFNTLDMDKVLEKAKSIADQKNYQYQNISVGVKS